MTQHCKTEVPGHGFSTGPSVRLRAHLLLLCGDRLVPLLSSPFSSQESGLPPETPTSRDRECCQDKVYVLPPARLCFSMPPPLTSLFPRMLISDGNMRSGYPTRPALLSDTALTMVFLVAFLEARDALKCPYITGTKR